VRWSFTSLRTALGDDLNDAVHTGMDQAAVVIHAGRGERDGELGVRWLQYARAEDTGPLYTVPPVGNATLGFMVSFGGPVFCGTGTMNCARS
jgi:hypothetical protein